MVSNDSLYPQTCVKKTKSLACLEIEFLHEVLHDLLQPIQVVLDLKVNMRPMEMVQNDFP